MTTENAITQSPRRPGRPRSAEADRAIVDATLDLLVSGGYQALSMEAVRLKAGVGKGTLYRRHPSKDALVKFALADLSAGVAVPDTGSVRADLHAMLGNAARQKPDVGEIVPRLLSELTGNPEFFAIVREELFEPRREMLRSVFRRGLERGELRADVDLEASLDMLQGLFMLKATLSAGTDTSPKVLWDRMLAAVDELLTGMGAA